VNRPLSPPADFCYPPGTISVDQALDFMLARARAPRAIDEVVLDDAAGGVLAADLRSPIDVPGYDNSQMDGYAVRASDVATAGVMLPVSQRIAAGTVGAPLAPASAARIFTGAPLPPGADTVVAQERCRVQEGSVWIPGPVYKGEDVRPRGNDITAGQVVIERGERLRPQHLGLAASLGLGTLSLFKRPRVAFFSCGDELRLPGEPLGPGQIYNSNRFVLRALIERVGASALDLGRIADTLDATVAVLERAAREADVVVSTGGVSVGEEDYVKQALQRVGELEMWRIAVRPGKPLAYGRVGEADFIGLPGNPVSALVTFCLFVRPFLLARSGARCVQPAYWPVRAGFDWPRPAQRREFARVRLDRTGTGLPEAMAHPRQGSDVLSSTTWADGLVEIPEGVTLSRGAVLRYLDFDALLA
jgi:molybdopterin molybdotransferase